MENEIVEIAASTEQSTEFNHALAFVLDYRSGKISDEYATSTSLAEMLLAYVKLSQQKQSAVWVKASERLPDNGTTVKPKVDGREYPSIIFNMRMAEKWVAEKFEWLDETPQPQLSDEEIGNIIEMSRLYQDGHSGFIYKYHKSDIIKLFSEPSQQTPPHENL